MLPCFFMVLIFIAVVFSKEEYIVHTHRMMVAGDLDSSGSYIEFLCIPYGIPVKFRAPTDTPDFDGVFKADGRLCSCAQFEFLSHMSVKSYEEYCLTLNVFTPTLPPDQKRPVMVFIHGGGFGVGSGSAVFYSPKFLMEYGIVVVSINYRLNIYGFLNLDIKEAPGNAGLKDIRHALRWIQKNIANFGGDEENVTVFGQGSGGIATLYLTLSKSCKGLFHRIISQSGTLFSPESFDYNPKQNAVLLAKYLGFDIFDSFKLYKFFSETDIESIEKAIGQQLDPRSLFVPSKETEFDGEEAFLTDIPWNIMTTINHKEFHPVPLIIGLNTVEGLVCALDGHTMDVKIERLKKGDLAVLDPKNFRIPPTNIEQVRKGLNTTYFSYSLETDAVLAGFIYIHSDFSYIGPMELFSELYYNTSQLPVYNYIFHYIGNRNMGLILANTTQRDTAHMDELFYIFDYERMSLPKDENDTKIIGFLTYLWTNFAITGVPNPKGSLVDGRWPPYYSMSISMEPRFRGALSPERGYIWRFLFYNYGIGIGD